MMPFIMLDHTLLIGHQVNLRLWPWPNMLMAHGVHWGLLMGSPFRS